MSSLHSQTAGTIAPPPRSPRRAWRPAPGGITIVLAALAAGAWYARHHGDTLWLLAEWTPSLLRAFGLNVLMGIVAIALATAGGTALGIGQCSPHRRRAATARTVTLVLRNAPWLVAVFYVMYLVPYELQVFGEYVFLPDWLKAAVGIAVPASGYMSEIVRGGIRSIPAQQWEAAIALGLDRRQILRRVVLPQALRSMTPPWMSLYCIVTLSTSLANLLGVEELMTTIGLRLSGETSPELLLPAHAYTFVVFFLYIYPISRLSRRFEKQWSLKE